MEVIRLSGYTEDEKVNIAMRHLLPKQLKNHGLKVGDNVSRAQSAISSATTRGKRVRGAGARDSICRKVGRWCYNAMRKRR
jgi:ATP-dependent Lon protease